MSHARSYSHLRPIGPYGQPLERRRLRGLMGRIAHRLLGPHAELHELMCLLLALGWGLMLAFVPGGVIERTRLVKAITEVWPAEIWAIGFLTYGLIGFIAYVQRRARIRQLCALAGVFGWSVTTYFLIRAFLPTISIIAAPIAAFASAVSYLRLDGGEE